MNLIPFRKLKALLKDFSVNDISSAASTIQAHMGIGRVEIVNSGVVVGSGQLPAGLSIDTNSRLVMPAIGVLLVSAISATDTDLSVRIVSQSTPSSGFYGSLGDTSKPFFLPRSYSAGETVDIAQSIFNLPLVEGDGDTGVSPTNSGNLITNADYSNGTNSFVSVDATLAIVAGRLRVESAVGGSYGSALVNVTVEVGATYALTIQGVQGTATYAPSTSVGKQGAAYNYYANAVQVGASVDIVADSTDLQIYLSSGSDVLGQYSDYGTVTLLKTANPPTANPTNVDLNPNFVAGTAPSGVNGGDWVLAASDSPVFVPYDFSGIHSDHTRGQVPIPAWGPRNYRTHDCETVHAQQYDMSPRYWVVGNQSAGTQYDSVPLDAFFNVIPTNVGVLFTLYGCPSPYNNHPSRLSKYNDYSGGEINTKLMGFAEPLNDASAAKRMTEYLVANYGSKIKRIDHGNEAKFSYYNNNATAHSTTWLDLSSKGFWHGTANQLLEEGRQIKLGIASSGIKLVSPGWEGGAGDANAILPSSKYNSAILFFEDAVAANGNRPNDIYDEFGFHTYYYSATANYQQLKAKLEETRNYTILRDRYMPGKGILNTELGFEGDGRGLNPADRSLVIKRLALINAALGVSQAYFYRYNNAPTLGDPIANNDVRAALAYSVALGGRIIRQLALLATGQVWVRFDDNTEETV